MPSKASISNPSSQDTSLILDALSHEEKPKEQRRRRNHLSCAECRRLKLRCDRNFPCKSCKKRGCAAICPDGALTTKGTRFVLANTEEYHAKISEMSERIRQLEQALGSLHPDIPHPLLRQDLLLVKVPVELNNKVDPVSFPEASKNIKESPRFDDMLQLQDASLPVLLNAYGTLKIKPNGRSIFFGQSANAEFFTKEWDYDTSEEDSHGLDTLPSEIRHLSHAFPSGSKHRSLDLVQKLLDFLPPVADLENLVELYYAHSAWIYEPCPQDVFQESFDHVLEYLNRPAEIDLHRLALVFIIAAHGSLTDLEREPYNSYSFQLYQLSRASLEVTPFVAEPSVPAIQTLFLLGFYLVLTNKKDAANAGWLIQCLNAKLAQALGLHRDLEDWDERSSPKEIDARRKSLWELITLEGWMSLGLGRPMTTKLSEVHCKMPEETKRAMELSDGKGIIFYFLLLTQTYVDSKARGWHTWKHGFAPYICRVLEKTLSVKTPPYLDILDLDHSIQTYNFPADVIMHINGITPPASPQEKVPGSDMQRCIFVQAHSMALVLLHRGFFGQALEENKDPMQSRFSPSILATYNSALRVIFALQAAYLKHPGLTRRFGMLWSNAFSASISLCLLVTCATRSSYASGAFQGLNLVYDLFSSAASECFPASIALPTMTRLREKAYAAYAPHNQGHPSLIPYRESSQDDNEDEELKTLGGKRNIAQLPVRPQRSLLNASIRQDVYPNSPMLIPLNDPVDSGHWHPLLLEYVAQSRWSGVVSPTSAEVGQTAQQYINHSMPSTEHLYVMGTEEHYDPQGQRTQHHTYTNDWDNSMRHANQIWTDPSPIPQGNHPHDGFTYLQHSYYSTKPALQSFPEADAESNQYAAWQAHMQQLGL